MAVTAAPPRLRVLPDREFSAIMRRGLLLQAGWNFEGMQNLGFLYAIEPGLARIHHDPEERRRAMMRHLGFFNTQPYMAGFAVGACMALEEDAVR
ncbi:MAG: PTS system mannose/fructose/sorbose family transporter subunit IID, partial [Elusimicrobia bacterium]|nr:PTS system mannose/fructose/sorbose family transporter subunit IID [Elusimicrobiota bacterium]